MISFPDRRKEATYATRVARRANVAISAARNGLKAGMYCKVGNDDFGKFLLDTLRENHVTPLAPEMTDDAVTTMAFVSLNEYNDRSFTFARKPGADMLLSKSEIKDEDLKDCRLFQAGSLQHCLQALLWRLRSMPWPEQKNWASMVGFDINYRNLIWKDDKDACTRKVLSVLKYVDFLKLSDEEIDMVGGHDKVPDVMKEYDIAVAVLTLGGDGAEVFYDGKSYVIPGFPDPKWRIPPEQATRSGAASLSCVLNHGVSSVDQLNAELLQEAVRYGNVSGSLSVQQKGAISSLPTREQVEQFLAEHKN